MSLVIRKNTLTNKSIQAFRLLIIQIEFEEIKTVFFSTDFFSNIMFPNQSSSIICSLIFRGPIIM